MSEKKRILTGIRPTGPLHLGHYAGALENWVKLQHEYDCSFLIADYQVSDYADDVPRVRNAVWEVALDWLAVGLDPEKRLEVTCCIAGGGPAGMMLGLLLARAGVDVVVLEKHADFLRDFRGDTIHPSLLPPIFKPMEKTNAIPN